MLWKCLIWIYESKYVKDIKTIFDKTPEVNLVEDLLLQEKNSFKVM